MKVIVDNKIPYIRETLSRLADEVIYLPGHDFTPDIVKDADALIIRTRTHCNRQLLEGSRVRFIGTATIGFDHIRRGKWSRTDPQGQLVRMDICSAFLLFYSN